MDSFKKDRPRPIFLEEKSLGVRPWGDEFLLAVVDNCFSFKRMFMRKGCHGNLQFHRKKNEVGFLVSGRLLVKFEGREEGHLCEKVLNPGDSFHFPPGSVHQEVALSDCVIIEASTPHGNDRVRVEPLFGMHSDPDGLPSTNESEITTLKSAD